MKRIDTLIIGGGQAGLAMSRSLSARGVENVVLERGRIGERWRSERWDSLTLLTPRWLSRIGGWTPDDQAAPTDSDLPVERGFMDRAELIGYLEAYARHHGAPVEEGVTVLGVHRIDTRFRVDTDYGTWIADRVVIATGHSQDALVPSMAGRLATRVHQVVPTRYTNPGQLPEGGVLVVGASATGIQLADEIHASGRPVTLAVGRHTRLPRSYRGRDILEWLHGMGLLDQRASEVHDLTTSMEQPSMQLVGSSDHRTLDLGTLVQKGIRLVGRATAAEGSRVHFADELVETVAAAEFKLAGLLERIDRYVRRRGLEGSVAERDHFRPVPLVDAPESIDLAAEGIGTVLWATGFRRSYPWLRVPVLDARGEIRHREGVTDLDGLYVIGLNFLKRRSSSFLAGIGADAEELADHLTARRAAAFTRSVA